jgi:hypothetical protein
MPKVRCQESRTKIAIKWDCAPIIQQSLNAILGPDHPASEMWATMVSEMEADMHPDDLLPDPELFESKVVYAYAGTLPPEAGRAGDEDHWRRAWDRNFCRLLTVAPSHTEGGQCGLFFCGIWRESR